MGMSKFCHVAARAAPWSPRGRPMRWVGVPKIRHVAARAAPWPPRALGG